MDGIIWKPLEDFFASPTLGSQHDRQSQTLLSDQSLYAQEF